MRKFLYLLILGPLMVFADCAGVNWSSTYNLFNVSGQDGVLPNVAIDRNGNAVAAWVNSPSNGSGSAFVQASYKVANGTWSVPQNVSGSVGVTITSPAVAIDKNGNAIVAWYQFGPNSVYTVQAKVRPAGISDSWNAVETPISPATSNAGDVVVAWDGNGNAVIGWSIFGGLFQTTTTNIQGVTTGIVSVSGTVENTSSAHMVANANGDIIATWINTTGSGGRQVEASIKHNGSAWPTIPLVVSPASDIAMYPTAAIDSELNATILWSLPNGLNNTTVRSSQKLNNQTSWSPALTLATNAYDPALAQVGMDDQGNVTAVWNQNQSSPANNPLVAVGTKALSDATWSTGTTISDSSHEAEGCISLGVDSANNAVAIWAYDSIGPYLGAIASKSRPLCSNNEWLSPEITLSGSGSNPGSCSLSINPTGDIVAIWATTSVSTSNSVIQGVTGTFALLPPTSVIINQYNNDFALVSEYYNSFSWTKSMSPNVAGYHIYQGATLIGTVGPNVTKFQQHNILKGQSYTYRITAFSSSGQESTPASGTIN